MSVNELLTLAKEVASIIDAREGPVLPLLKRVLGKAESIEKLLNLSSTEIDMLEQCGVDLWNNALHLNLVPSAVTDETIATLREIGYRMIRPATESVPATFESVLQQFEMACFRGKAWTDCEQYDRASAAFDDAERCNAQFDSLEFTTKRSVTMNIRQATCILQFYMFKAELHVRQGNWEVAREQFSKAVDYCVSNLPLIDDKNNIRIEFLCRLGIAISQDLINQNKFIDSLELIGCVFSKFDYQAHDEQFMLLLMQTIAHAILYVTTTLESSLQTTLIEIIQNAIAMFPNLRDNKEYHLAKLGALTKGELLKAKSDNVMLEIAYIEAMENFPIDQAKTPACYLVTTARLMINCLSMDVICEGLDLVLQRRRGTVQENAFSMGSLYLIKLYILSDAVNHSNHSIELCLTKTINDLYMDRQDITPTDLNACQMTLWYRGDSLFYEEKDIENAIKWYKHTRALSMTAFKGSKNSLRLARQLTRCYLMKNQFQLALECLSEAMEDCAQHCTAVDYLLKVDIYLQLNDNNYTPQVRLCIQELPKSEGFQFDMLLALASTAFHKSPKRDKTILNFIVQEASELSNLTNTAHTVQILHMLRWIICANNSFDQLPVLQNRTLDEQTADSIREISETIDQASDLICKCDNSSNELRNLSEWFISAAWNLGLQCCERAMEYRGRQFLLTACKLMKKVTGDTQAMDKRQKISLFMCIAAKQLSGNSEMSDHQEILSVSQTLAQDQEYDPSICELLQIFQVVSFVALNKYPQAINAIENCCKAASDPSQLCLCERLVEYVAVSPNCTVKDALQVLQYITSLYQRLEQPRGKRYSQWIRVSVSAAMVVSKDVGLQYLQDVFTDLKQHASMTYPESELYYLVVVAWNEGVTWFHANDSHRGRAWCKLAFDLLSLFNNANQRETLHNKLSQAYGKFKTA